MFFIVVANLPQAIIKSKQKISLEGFLKGVLSGGPEKKLIYADKVKIKGKKALDFFIEGSGALFRGYVVVRGARIYLLAMESSKDNYDNRAYARFIGSAITTPPGK